MRTEILSLGTRILKMKWIFQTSIDHPLYSCPIALPTLCRMRMFISKDRNMK